MKKSGNIKDLIVNGKKLLMISRHKGLEEIAEADPQGWTWVARIEGWHRGRNIGHGASEEAAIRDMAVQCGCTVAALLDACDIERSA